MIYSEPVFRPPSEADSLIVQVTEGCHYNRCLFCPMYKRKIYREKNKAEIESHLDELQLQSYKNFKRAFLADGDSLIVSNKKLLQSMDMIKFAFQQITRFGIYGSVYSLKTKSVGDLKELKANGLRFVYVGLESGDEETLKKVNKFFPPQDMVTQCRKVLDAGISLSVMIIIGLGGKEYSKNHIRKSAGIINAIAPTYTSLLNLMLQHTKLNEDDFYKSFTARDYFKEVREFIRRVKAKTIFRSNHASNLISLSGRLPDDRNKLLELLDNIDLDKLDDYGSGGIL